MHKTSYNFQIAALELANALKDTIGAIGHLQFFHGVDKFSSIELLKEQKRILWLHQRKIWTLVEAEWVCARLSDSIYNQILCWLKDQKILLAPNCSKEDVVLTAIQAGWTLDPSTPHENVA